MERCYCRTIAETKEITRTAREHYRNVQVTSGNFGWYVEYSEPREAK